MPIFPKSGATALQRLPFSKYYDVLKWQSRFTLGLNAAKNVHYIKNASNKICSKLNFVQKSQSAHMSISPRNGPGPQRSPFSEYFDGLKLENIFTLGLMQPKIRVISKNALRKGGGIKKLEKMPNLSFLS